MGQPKSPMMRGIPGVATKEQMINTTEKAGELAESADANRITATQHHQHDDRRV